MKGGKGGGHAKIKKEGTEFINTMESGKSGSALQTTLRRIKMIVLKMYEA